MPSPQFAVFGTVKLMVDATSERPAVGADVRFGNRWITGNEIEFVVPCEVAIPNGPTV